MRRGRRRIPATPMVTVTSMMDMFTIILVFLLNFLDPTQQQAAELALPTSRATEAAPSDAVTLTVSRDAVLVAGQHVAGASEAGLDEAARAALEGALETARSRSKDATLRVAADKAVPYRVLVAALRAAGDAGFEQYSFVVISDPGTGG
ncbi:MAG: ExbD/TolR family protein [Myxococcota bacterium]